MNWQHFSDLLQREMAGGIVGRTIARLIPFTISGAASLGLVERE